MKVYFFGLCLLLALGLTGCGSDTSEQDAARGSSADDGNGSLVVLSPPGKTQETVTPPTGGTSSTSSQTQERPAPSPEPGAAIEPSPKALVTAPSKSPPAAAPAAQPDPVDATPKRDIFRSAGSGDLDAVKYHLANGINVNQQDKTGKTPLLWAVRSQKHAVVSHLLARGANPNLADRSNVTPLFWAVRQRRPELVSHLLARGADIAHKDKKGRTAIDYAKDETVIAILRRHASEKE